ncbi:WD40 repeat-like protein, partial [Gyrodon lividus]
MSDTSRKSVDLTPKPLMTMSDHEDTILNMAYLPREERVVTCSNDGLVRIWNVEDGEQEGMSMKHDGYVLCLAVTRDGKRILSGGYDHQMKVWSWHPSSGELLLGPIKGHKDYVNCVLWSLDGCRLFSASDDRSIRCWNSETGEPIGQPWTGHTYWVISLSLSPDGTRLASASHDHTVRLWDAQSGEPIEQPLQHDHWLRAVTFSPTGEFVACGGDDKKVSIWRVPWWDDGQKQAHDSFLDLPAVPAPKGLAHNQAQLDVDFLD